MKRFDLPAVWLVVFLGAAWAQVRHVPSPFPQPLGRDIGALAILVGLFLLFLLVAATRQFRRHSTTIHPRGTATELLTAGIFGKSRNPIYLAFILILAGTSLWFGSVLGLLLVPALVAMLERRFIGNEEKWLRAAFGEAYQSYTEETRRWL